MQARNLDVEIRTEKGKNACYRLRQLGYIPAVIYSHGTSEVIQVGKKDFSNLFKGYISESVLIDINITNKKQDCNHKVFIKDYQLDPVSDEVLHLDLYKIQMDEKIQTMMPIEIIGVSSGVKMGGILEVMEREIEIECLPADLPENLKVDISNLEIGDSIHLGDLSVPDSVKLLGGEERVIVAVSAPHLVEEETVEEEAEEAEELEAADESSPKDVATGKGKEEKDESSKEK